MKVGGNGNAQEFFRQHGGLTYSDAKAKYSSRAASMYKDKLQQKVQDDARR
jgi:ADP-ribosylation factor GTPase-activating protein 2/3